MGDRNRKQETGGDREPLRRNGSQRGEIEPRTGEIGSSWVDRAGGKGARRAIGVKKERAKEGGRESGVAVRGGREGQREKSAGGGTSGSKLTGREGFGTVANVFRFLQARFLRAFVRFSSRVVHTKYFFQRPQCMEDMLCFASSF
jgi:hypothetical protein